MEAILFIGVQGAGKTTFYRERFFETHVRISLDMLKTRRREGLLFEACLQAKQPFVIDNTNPTAADRARYIPPARAAGFRVVGFFFETDPRAALRRNRARGRQVPLAGFFGTLKRLEPPAVGEGFDRLYRVQLREGAGFEVAEYPAYP